MKTSETLMRSLCLFRPVRYQHIRLEITDLITKLFNFLTFLKVKLLIQVLTPRFLHVTCDITVRLPVLYYWSRAYCTHYSHRPGPGRLCWVEMFHQFQHARRVSSASRVLTLSTNGKIINQNINQNKMKNTNKQRGVMISYSWLCTLPCHWMIILERLYTL